MLVHGALLHFLMSETSHPIINVYACVCVSWWWQITKHGRSNQNRRTLRLNNKATHVTWNSPRTTASKERRPAVQNVEMHLDIRKKRALTDLVHYSLPSSSSRHCFWCSACNRTLPYLSLALALSFVTLTLPACTCIFNSSTRMSGHQFAGRGGGKSGRVSRQRGDANGPREAVRCRISIRRI